MSNQSQHAGDAGSDKPLFQNMDAQEQVYADNDLANSAETGERDLDDTPITGAVLPRTTAFDTPVPTIGFPGTDADQAADDSTADARSR